MWAIKYKPKTLAEFAGNKASVDEILKWARNWKSEKKKILLIEGPPGSGKTTATELIAKELGYHLVATNASDLRSAGAISNEFGASLQQQSLFARGKLVVFDEVDGLSSGDRGGVGEILKISKVSKYPIILVANDSSLPKLKPVKMASKIVEFAPLDSESIRKRLAEILHYEKIEYEERALKSIASMSGGDIKAAINDLEALAEGTKKLSQESIKNLGYRDSAKSVGDSLKMIFNTMSARTAAEAVQNMDADADELIQWIRENLPYEYTDKKDLAAAYSVLSRADVFNGRITRQQYWEYLSYVFQLSSVGIALSKKEKYSNVLTYRFPTKIAMMGRTRIMRAERNRVAGILGAHLHCSKRDALLYLPLLDEIEKARPEEYAEFAEKIGLLKEEEASEE